MPFRDFIISRSMIQGGLFVGQHMPRWMGYGLARIISSVIACQKPQVYWTVRVNLRQVLGSEVDDGTLHEMTRQVFFHAGQTYYDFFHAIGQPPEVLINAVRIPETVIERIKSEMARGRGVLLLGTHMSNFDLLILALGAYGLPGQILSVTDPHGGFRLMNRLRAKGGSEVTPIAPESLRMAIRRLKSGGLVLTGMDFPVHQDRELIEVFGRPAYLPVGPVRMALMTGAVVFMGRCHFKSDEGYVMDATGPIEMVRTGDRRQDVFANIRRLAAILEGYVRAHPEQWMMFHPFWPETT
jgi:KDO2-lipid IV(A) lauroyltransferase